MDEFELADLAQYKEAVGEGRSNRSWPLAMIRRALRDACAERKIESYRSDEFHAGVAIEARDWIRNPESGFPSLRDCCESLRGNLSIRTVQKAMDLLLEKHSHPLE